MAERRVVTIPATAEHAGFQSMTVELPWTCLVCGGPRGEPYKGLSFDGSRRLAVDLWKNPCGHNETYGLVREHLASGGGTPAVEPASPGLRAEVEAVLRSVEEAIQVRGRTGGAAQDFDTVSTWLTLALAGRYVGSFPRAERLEACGAGPCSHGRGCEKPQGHGGGWHDCGQCCWPTTRSTEGTQP